MFVCACLEVLGEVESKVVKCPQPQQGQRWEPLTSEGTDCHGQLVWPVYLFISQQKTGGHT